MSETEGKYSVELFKEGDEGADQEEIIDRHDNLTVARAIYRGRVSQYPGRLVMLCDRARVLARSDRPDDAVKGHPLAGPSASPGAGQIWLELRRCGTL